MRIFSIALAITAVFSAAWTIGRAGPVSQESPILAVPVIRSDTTRIVAHDVNGKTVSELTYRGALFPAWSPDGKRIAFVAGQPRQIFAMNTDASGVVQLTKTKTVEQAPSWSPDGKKIAFDSMRDGNHEIFAMERDGSNPMTLTNHMAWDSDPAWSPDGKQIAFASNRSGAFRLWIMDSDGSNQRELVARDLGGWVLPAWAPDGKQILFCGQTDKGAWQVFVANSDGQSVEKLTEEPGCNLFPAWSPDGRYVAYLHFDKQPDQATEGGKLIVLDTTDGSRTAASQSNSRYRPRPAWKPMKQ